MFGVKIDKVVINTLSIFILHMRRRFLFFKLSKKRREFTLFTTIFFCYKSNNHNNDKRQNNIKKILEAKRGTTKITAGSIFKNNKKYRRQEQC